MIDFFHKFIVNHKILTLNPPHRREFDILDVAFKKEYYKPTKQDETK